MKSHALSPLAAIFSVLALGAISAQTSPVMPPGHGGEHTMSAAGMPLLDGELPPGVLTVRLIRGAFVENLSGEEISVDVSGGKRETSVTGRDGRAQIAHLPIGVQLRVTALVSGERIESNVFEMPPDSGVRLLLIAEGGTQHGQAAEDVDALATLMAAPASFHGASPPAEPERDGGGAMTMGGVLALSAVAFAAFVFWRRPSGFPPEPRGDDQHLGALRR
jgi:hypothetical protein